MKQLGGLPARTGRIAWVAGLCWFLCECGTEEPALRRVRPTTGANVVLITMDTTRADALGCYGNAQARTPVLDRLASEGVRFTNATSCSPMTAPSHASMLTGRYPFAHHVRVNGSHRLAEGQTTLAEILKDEGYVTRAEIASAVLDARYGLGQGFDGYRDVQSTSAAVGLPERYGDDIADSTIRELRSLAASGETFFVWAHFFDPHHPFKAPAYEGDDPEEAYLAEVTFMDAQIGRIVDTLHETGLDRKTVVILVGDHGEAFSEHDEVGHGYFIYRTTMQVPLILWGPSVLPGDRVVTAAVRTVDLTPTVLQLLQVDAGLASQGDSLLPLIDGAREELDSLSYGESLRGYLRFGLCPVRSVTSGDWKLIWSSRPALFNIAADPDEQLNVYADHPEIAEELRRSLFSLVEDAANLQSQGPASVPMSSQERSRLQSLGYLGGDSGSSDSVSTSESDLLQTNCSDPTEHARAINLSSSAVAALALGRYGVAEQQFRELLAHFGDSPNLLADLARALAGQHRITEAVSLFERALVLAPQDSVVRNQYLEELIGAAMWTEALEQASILETSAPGGVEAAYGKGMALVGQGRLVEAMVEFEQARRSHPEDERPVRGLVLAMTSKGMMAAAEKLLREELSGGRSSALLLRDLAYTVERQGRLDEALEIMSKALALNSRDGQILKYNASLLAAAGRTQEALGSLTRALDLAPADLDAILSKAAITGPLDRGDEVLSDFERARGLAPDDLRLARAMAQHLVLLERPAEAETVLRDSLAHHPTSVVLIGDLAGVAQKQGRTADADEHYRKALELDPDLRSVRVPYAAFLMDQGRFEEAARELETLAASSPNALNVHYNLARVYNRLGRYPEAIEHLEQAVVLAPDDVRPRFALATIHLRANQVDEAETTCRELLRMDPSHQGATQLLDRIRESKQR